MEESEFPGFLEILAHVQTVCTRLSFQESLGSRLSKVYALEV